MRPGPSPSPIALDAPPGVEPTTAHLDLALAHGRHLVVRDVRPDDAARLASLYATMDDEDRQRRFLCAHHPPAEWFEKLAAPAERGARLVAEQRTGTETTLVGEVGDVLLPNGNADLACSFSAAGEVGSARTSSTGCWTSRPGAVSPTSRRTCSPSTGRCSRCCAERGALVLEHDGWNTITVRVGTTESVASWHGDGDRPRVLVEAPGGRWSGEDALKSAPSAQHRCPALECRRCPLADGADTVIVRYPVGDTRWEALIEAHRRQHPEVAVLLDAITPWGARTSDEQRVSASTVIERLSSPAPTDRHHS